MFTKVLSNPKFTLLSDDFRYILQPSFYYFTPELSCCEMSKWLVLLAVSQHLSCCGLIMCSDNFAWLTADAVVDWTVSSHTHTDVTIRHQWRFGKWLAVVWCKTCRLDGLKTLELDLRLHPSTPWGLCNGVVVSRPEEFADGLPNIRRRQPECLEFCLADRESMYCSTERPSCDALWEIMAECFWSFRRRMATLVS